MVKQIILLCVTAVIANAGFFDKVRDHLDTLDKNIDERANWATEKLDKVKGWVDKADNANEHFKKTIVDYNENNKNKFDHIREEIVDTLDAVTDIYHQVSDEVFDFADTVGSIINGDVGVRNVTCITRHCSGELASCTTDDMCSSNFLCAAGCGDNSTCTFYCSESYTGEKVDDLMRCMFVDHQCLYLPDPTYPNNADNRDPADQTVGEIDESLLEGTWFVNYGFHPDYDCFACQELSFFFNGTDESPIWYNALYDLHAVNGSLIWNDINM